MSICSPFYNGKDKEILLVNEQARSEKMQYRKMDKASKESHDERDSMTENVPDLISYKLDDLFINSE